MIVVVSRQGILGQASAEGLSMGWMERADACGRLRQTRIATELTSLCVRSSLAAVTMLA